MRLKSALLCLTTVLAFSANLAHANLIVNGNFEETTKGGNKKIEGTNLEKDRTTLVGWTSSKITVNKDGSYNKSANGGYNFVLDGANANKNGSAMRFEYYQPNGKTNGYTASPTGGNIFASDSQYETGMLSQLVNGLTIGASYILTFDYALAQQYGYGWQGGNLANYWEVGFGKAIQNTVAMDLPAYGFSGWKEASMTFTATGASELLSFLAKGTAPGAPPFMLLDNVSLTAAVPEPATWALMLAGLGAVGFMARRRRNTVA